MVQNFLSLSTWFLLFLYVEHLGERSLAVTNIIRNVSGIMFMVMMAFASTCGSLVSNLIGAGHTDCVPGTIRQHIRIAYAFVLPLAVFFALCPKLILSVYTDMPELHWRGCRSGSPYRAAWRRWPCGSFLLLQHYLRIP